MLRNIRKHYHWLIAVLVFLEMIVYGGLINSASVFIQPISQGLQVSTTSYSVAMMPYTVTCFIGTCLTGWLFGRFGYKKIAMVSLAVVAFSLALTAMSTNIYVFCISKILFGLGYGACFTAGAVRVVKDWFWKHQGLILGAVSMATGLGGSLMTIMLTKVIQSHNWRVANYVAAAVVLAIFVLYFLVKDRPEQMQLKPFGYGAKLKQKKVRQELQEWEGYPLKEQLKKPLFYLMCLCVMASCVCIYTTSSFMIPHFTSQGFTMDQAAAYQSVYMLSLAAVKLVVGFLYDRFGAKPVMLGCMICAVVGQGMLAYSNHPALCLVAVVIFAVGLCMTSIMIPLIATPLFGHKACLSINGIFLGLSSFSSIFANPISSICYDKTGVYTPVYRVTSLILVGVMVMYLLLFTISKRERARHTQ